MKALQADERPAGWGAEHPASGAPVSQPPAQLPITDDIAEEKTVMRVPVSGIADAHRPDEEPAEELTVVRGEQPTLLRLEPGANPPIALAADAEPTHSLRPALRPPPPSSIPPPLPIPKAPPVYRAGPPSSRGTTASLPRVVSPARGAICRRRCRSHSWEPPADYVDAAAFPRRRCPHRRVPRARSRSARPRRSRPSRRVRWRCSKAAALAEAAAAKAAEEDEAIALSEDDLELELEVDEMLAAVDTATATAEGAALDHAEDAEDDDDSDDVELVDDDDVTTVLFETAQDDDDHATDDTRWRGSCRG